MKIENINDKIVQILQKLDLECQSRKEIINFILTNNLNIDINTYLEEYDKKNYEFTVMKQELENTYILPKIKDKKCNWQLDYSSKTIIINFID